MSKEPPQLLPPIEPANYVLTEFEWCQFLYLYARELTMGPSDVAVDWNEALSEAREVVRVMQDSKTILTPTPWLPSPGYTDMVHWPSQVCAANAYASMPPALRQEFRQRMAEGTSPIFLLSEMGSGGCHPRVLADEEYLPEPPCIPAKAAAGFWLAGSAFVGTFALMTLWGWAMSPKQR